MAFVQNVPFFCIMLCMISGIVAAVLPKSWAKWWTVGLAATVAGLNAWLLLWMIPYGQSYSFMMGHFPAPWGNEIRGGVLEALMAVAFSLILLMSVLGGMAKMSQQVNSKKHSLFFVMLDLVLASMMALIYTNDLFTAYVFIEILTLAGCTLIMARQNGHTMVAAMRYMIMSLLGSGLVLIAIAMLYNLTGHLLMQNIRESIAALVATGQYGQPLTVIIGLFIVGLGIKTALFPFHTWLPDAYGFATPTASAVMSSLVSKGYLFLLVKIMVRVIGMEVIVEDHATSLLFGFGVAGMLMGSLAAIRSHDLRRMVAFSSVAQIGYIYAGLGLGTLAGAVAALYHLLMHSMAKSMLFLASSGLADASGDSKRFADLRGAGFRYPAAGAAFTVGALSLAGVPIFGGFISKIYFSQAALDVGGPKMWIMLIALAVSTLLNAFYFLHTVISLYRPPRDGFQAQAFSRSTLATASLWVLVALNFLAGLLAEPILAVIRQGLQMFG